MYLDKFDNDYVTKSKCYLLDFALSYSYVGYKDASFQGLFYIFKVVGSHWILNYKPYSLINSFAYSDTVSDCISLKRDSDMEIIEPLQHKVICTSNSEVYLQSNH